MILSWTVKLLSSLLVIVTLSVVANIIISQTIFNSSYIKHQLTKADAYNRLSSALAVEASKQAGIDNPQVQTAVQQVITPSVIQQKIDSAVTQSEAYYKGEGTPPQIDVSDLSTQLQAAGVPLQQDSQLNKPIELAPTRNPNSQPVTAKLGGVRVLSLVLLVALLVVLAILSIRNKRYKILPSVAISCGIALGLLALLFSFSPGALDRYVKFDTSSNAFASIAHDLLENIATDIGHRYGLYAIVLLVLGISTRLAVGRMKTTQSAKI